jgi:hypothetical protein
MLYTTNLCELEQYRLCLWVTECCDTTNLCELEQYRLCLWVTECCILLTCVN